VRGCLGVARCCDWTPPGGSSARGQFERCQVVVCPPGGACQAGATSLAASGCCPAVVLLTALSVRRWGTVGSVSAFRRWPCAGRWSPTCCLSLEAVVPLVGAPDRLCGGLFRLRVSCGAPRLNCRSGCRRCGVEEVRLCCRLAESTYSVACAVCKS